jgi:tetratricopeptide (TPR) repeat protein
LGLAGPLRTLAQAGAALPLAERGVQMFPRRPDAWYELGMVQLDLGIQEAALEAFARAPAMNWPQNELIFEHQGAILCRLGRYEPALAMYNRALIFTPYNLTLLRGRLEALRTIGREREAKQTEAQLRPIEEAQERRQKTRPW